MTAPSPEAMPVPSELDLAPVGANAVAPPVDTLNQELPVGELRWENFERLCLRLARQQSDVIGAELYGTPGQKQEGIDLYARLTSPPGYRVYQCKRYEELDSSAIKKAVKRFTDGKWATRARELVICTSDDLQRTKPLEVFEAQRQLLEKAGVTLIPWARSHLSQMLKTQPLVVHDFFGQPWVEKFCGAAAAATTTGRLSPTDLTALRAKLAELYRSVFAAQDPGLRALMDEKPIPLRERFIIPDVMETAIKAIAVRQEVVGATTEVPQVGDEAAHPSPGVGLGREVPRVDSPRTRVPLFSHIAGSADSCRVILGGPGSGKSTLLRFIALDLLSGSPRESQLAQLWGTRLPLWIPFGAWVERIARNDQQAPLPDVLKAWLTQWGAGDFFPLVEAALRDRRLLLLVDGLDEWTAEDAARIALTRLQVFLDQSGATALVTSRPDGFKKISGCLQGWKTADLAPLSHDQQLELAERWFSQLAGGGALPSTVGALAQAPRRQALEAMEAIGRIPDARALAEVPLLLSALLLLKVQNVDLPSDRFQAYAQLAHQLMVVHPSRRRAAAQVQVVSTIREAELERAYANLAFRVHSDSPTGLFSQGQAQQHLAQALADDEFGIGYSPQEATRLARQLVEIGESVSGILVRRSHDELSFFHRCLQEHLASVHLASLSQERQLAHVGARAADPQWREVILAMLARTRSGDVIEQAVNAIENLIPRATPVEQLRLAELLAEIGAGPSACRIPTRRRLLEDATRAIEQGWSRRHRENLLASVLGGLRIQPVRAFLLPRLRGWFPERVWVRDRLLRSLADWPSEEAWEHLSFALHGESSSAQLTAADLISQRWRDDVAALDRLRRILKGPISVMTRAAVMKAWLDGWQTDAAFHSELNTNGADLCIEIRLVKALAATKAGDRSSRTRDEIAACVNFGGADYAWRRAAVAALVQYWRGDVDLRDACIDSITGSQLGRAEIYFEDAWSILFAAFPGDETVANLLIRELQSDRQGFDTINWGRLAASFENHPGLTSALEKWIAGSDPLAATRIAGAALVGRTPRGKAALLKFLRAGDAPWWPARALLDGWGMSDSEVADTLTSLAEGANQAAASIGHLLPRVIPDPERCYRRLLELIRDPSIRRVDFVIDGINTLGRAAEVDVVDAALKRIDEGEGRSTDALASVLLRRASNDPAVRGLALRALNWADPPYEAIAAGFPGDSEMRGLIARALRPLAEPYRQLIADRLEETSPSGEDVASICDEYRGERLSDAASAAAIVAFRNRAAIGPLADVQIDFLRRELSCYGPFFEQRRQAAYAAALEVGQLTLIDEQTERIGEPTGLRIGLGNSTEPNMPLVRQVLANWGPLQQLYPDAVLSRLSDRLSGSSSTDADVDERQWSYIAGLADLYPAARARLDLYLAGRDGLLIPSPLLQYLSRRAPRSQQLKDRCLAALHAKDRTSFHSLELEQVSVEILVSQFRDDDTLWDTIARELPTQSAFVRVGQFVALARARPQHPKTLEAAQAIVQNALGGAPYAVFHALCCVGEAKGLIDYALRYWGREGGTVGTWLYRPLVERLRRDGEALRAFLDALPVQGNSTFVALSLAIDDAAPLPPAVTSRLADLLNTELSGTRPTGYALDPRSGTVEPIATLIVEILSGSA